MKQSRIKVGEIVRVGSYARYKHVNDVGIVLEIKESRFLANTILMSVRLFRGDIIWIYEQQVELVKDV